MSKLLNFIKPQTSHTWDSDIYRFLQNKEPYYYQIGKVQNYLDYLELLERLTNNN